jgi:hypothetical protein
MSASGLTGTRAEHYRTCKDGVGCAGAFSLQKYQFHGIHTNDAVVLYFIVNIAGPDTGIRRNPMAIPLRDRGNYYRSLLVLIWKDRHIDDRERELMIRFGQDLDFDRRFCEAAINDLPENKHIRDEPVEFSNRATAESFIHDAVRLALIDGELHPKELHWLESVSNVNGLDDQWLHAEIIRLCGKKGMMDFFGSPSSGGVSSDSIGHKSPIS